MRTLVIYYSYSGHTKRLAEMMAKEMLADLCPVVEKKRPGTLWAYTLGCYAALRGKAAAIEVLALNPVAYDELIVMGPVWAGRPAPALLAVFEQLPPSKNVEVMMVSASGQSRAKEVVEPLIKGRKSFMRRFENIKAST